MNTPILHLTKNINGVFRPAGVVRSNLPSTTTLTEIVRAVKATLIEDWPEYKPDVMARAGCVCVHFQIDENDSDLPGIFAYMKTFLARHKVSLRYKLRKSTSRWGVRASDSVKTLLFVLLPPWTTDGSHI